MNETYLNTFLYWIEERDAILTRKQMGESVLTDDPILQKYSFCNVRREDDRGTIWNRETIRPYWNHPEYLLIATMARLLNQPDTLDIILDAGVVGSITLDIELLKSTAEDCLANGHKIIRSAYHNGKPHEKGLTHAIYFKNQMVALRQLLPQWNQAMFDKDTESLWGVITTPKGLSSFLPNQIMMDIAHTPLMEWSDYKDEMTSIGPGSKRGLTKLYGGSKDFMDKITELRGIVRAQLSMDLSAHDIQNCLCEFDKYTRIDEGVKSSLKRYGS